jgi:hypothetical protein
MEQETGNLIGYDKVASLMTQHGEMAMFQRFNYLNTLNTLYLQAELVFLEQKIKNGLRGDLVMNRGPASESGQASTSNGASGLGNGTHGEQTLQNERVEMRNSRETGESINLVEIPRVSRTSGNGNDSDRSPTTTLAGTDLRVSQSPSNNTSTQDRPGLPIGLLPDPARDWYDLSTMKETSEVWNTMLQARAKLKEYSSCLSTPSPIRLTSHPLKTNITPNNISQDETLLLLTHLKSHPSPNKSDHSFLLHWFRHPSLGSLPLLSLDQFTYLSSPPSSLLALTPRQGTDPIYTLLSAKLLSIYHFLLGKYLKTSAPHPQDLEANARYFEYKDKYLLRTANCLGSLISSGLLVTSILVLYFVRDMAARLGVVAVFTVAFSLGLSLLTSARKVEVFAGTAA